MQSGKEGRPFLALPGRVSERGGGVTKVTVKGAVGKDIPGPGRIFPDCRVMEKDSRRIHCSF
jgi:hypothetical protein